MTIAMKPHGRRKPDGVPDLGRNLKHLRWVRGLNLSQISAAAGIPQSTLSKVENGQMSLNFEKLLRLARALDIGVERLFVSEEDEASRRPATGRRALDPWAEAKLTVDHYVFRFLCTELKNRRMVPMYYEVGDRAEAEDPDRPGHVRMMNVIGERFTFVLEGPVEFHSEHYEPSILQTGDSIYVDASMPHAFVSPTKVKAHILSVVTSGDEEYLEAVRRATLAGDPNVSDRIRKFRMPKKMPRAKAS